MVRARLEGVSDWSRLICMDPCELLVMHEDAMRLALLCEHIYGQGVQLEELRGMTLPAIMEKYAPEWRREEVLL